VTRTVDFRRPTPRGEAGGHDDGDGGRTTAWPARRQYSYTPGAPDVLPDGGNGGGAPSHGQAGAGGHGSSRVLSSGVVVGTIDLSTSHATRRNRRGRGGRKIRQLKATAAAALSAGRQEEEGTAGSEPLGGGDAVKSAAAATGVELESGFAEDGLVKSSGTGALGDGAEGAGSVAVGACAVVRVGSLVVLPVACQRVLPSEPPSVQGEARDSRASQNVVQRVVAGQEEEQDMLAGPPLPGPVLGQNATPATSPQTQDVHVLDVLGLGLGALALADE
jgi:hypothetical protein